MKTQLRLFTAIVICFLFNALPVSAQITFIENKGQWGNKIKYRADIPGGQLYVENGRLNYILADPVAFREMHDKHTYDKPVQLHYFRVTFEGCNPNPTYVNEQTAETYYNFFIGNDPSRWASGAKAHQKITVKDIYPGIDLEIFGSTNNSLKYNLIIKPGANPKVIKMRYEGLDDMHLSNRQLHLHTSLGEITEMAPVCYQLSNSEVKYVKTDYSLDGNLLTFDIKENYNPKKSFIIDPQLVFSTYSGAFGDNWGYTATWDNNGNGYSGGASYFYFSNNVLVSDGSFPVTPGAFQRNFRNGVEGTEEDLARDAAVYKVSSDGKSLIYATYLGGTHNEEPHSMIVNSRNELIVFGTTFSSNFPVSTGAYDNSFNGKADIFVFVLSADGKSMVGSTFIGGSGLDGLNGDANPAGSPLAYNYGDQYRGEVIVDGSDNIYVATSTQSSGNFPVKSGFQSSYGGDFQDGCVFKLSENVSSLEWSSYLGGSGVDVCNGIDLDSKGNVLVAGGTTKGINGITSGMGEQTSIAGGLSDAFLVKIVPQGDKIENATYLGTGGYDQGYFVKVDKYDNPYVTGQTDGTWPVTAPIYTHSDGGQFICKFTPDLSTRTRSMVYGHGTIKPQISPSAFLVDECERIFISGWGGTVNAAPAGHGGSTAQLPVSTDAYQKKTDGSDFYLAVFSRNLDTLLYATFMGGVRSNPPQGEHVDGGTSRFDRRGIIYQSVCAGCGGNSLFPTTPGAHSQTNNSQNCNNAILKLDFQNLNRPPVVNDIFYPVTVGQHLQFTYYGIDPDPYDSIFFDVDKGGFTKVGFPTPLPQINYSSKGIKIVPLTFDWTPTCDHLTGDTIYMRVKLHDEGCPDSKNDSAVIKILVLPRPTNPPVVTDVTYTVTAGTNLQFNYVGSDPDGDSVYFNIISDFSKPGFKGVKPVVNAPSAGIQQVKMTFDWTPTCSQVTGDTQYIKTYIRDVGCTSSQIDSGLIKILVLPPPNNAPVVNDVFYSVIAGDTLKFTYTGTDPDAADSVYFSLSQGAFAKPTFPGAKPQISYPDNGIKQIQLDFNWITECLHVTGDTVYMKTNMHDIGCPVNKYDSSTIKILVLPQPVLPPPSVVCLIPYTPTSVKLKWQGVDTGSKYFSHIIISKTDPAGKITQLGPFKKTDPSEYTDNAVTDYRVQNYCYYIYTVNTCGKKGPNSYTICSRDQFTAPIKAAEVVTATVVDNKDVKLVWLDSKEDDFDSYLVFRSPRTTTGGHGDKYVFYGSTTKTNDTTFIDKKVNVNNESYCYKLQVTDKCGHVSQYSNKGCNIVLRGHSEPYEHHLTWDNYQDWEIGPDNYEIIRWDDRDNPATIYKGAPAVLNTIDDQLDYDWGAYWYKVIAHEDKGNLAESVSNELLLIQKPLLHVPTAFTPTGDNLNEVWGQVDVFVKEYHMQVFNRWGQKVWESYDKNEQWDGAFVRTTPDDNVFIWTVRYTGWDKSIHNKKGTVTILN